MSKALIIVDMQNDFMDSPPKVEHVPSHGANCNDYTGCQDDCGWKEVEVPSSALPVPGALAIVPNIVKEAYSGYDLIVATRDFHPQTHISFKEVGGGWPMHCVAGTEGAQLLPEIDMVADVIVSKGTDPNKEAYSGFEGTRLLDVLPEDVEEVVICGVATDYCVLNTAMDARALLADGIIVSVLLDCIAGVEEETTGDALIEMEDHGINLHFRG